MSPHSSHSRRLPAGQAPNPLTRVPIAFDTDPLETALAPFQHYDHPVVVLEGVLPYLTPEQAHGVMATLRSRFRRVTLICDIMTRPFVRRYSGRMREALGKLGARFAQHDREMPDVIEEAGFRLTARESIAGRSVALGALRMPRWLLATVFRLVRDGHAVATFEAEATGAGESTADG